MKIYDILVDQIISKMENWYGPWQKPWKQEPACNYITGTQYRWFNKLLLMLNDFSDNRYLTMKQVKELWWSVKKWSKWNRILYFANAKKENWDDTVNFFPFIKYYVVFNVEQTTGIHVQERFVLDNSDNFIQAQNLINNFKDKPKIIYGANACYDMNNDTIMIPPLEKFNSSEAYYSTLFHELIHSTWSPKRLWRFHNTWLNYFGSDTYSKEELIAELGAMFLCMKWWISYETKESSETYIAGWLKYIKWNKKDLIQACMKADRAIEYMTTA